jgi:hypothetical protein
VAALKKLRRQRPLDGDNLVLKNYFNIGFAATRRTASCR